jgi:hypothetical protein
MKFTGHVEVMMKMAPSGIVNISLPLGRERYLSFPVCASMGTSAMTQSQEIPQKSYPSQTSLTIPNLMASPTP